MQVRRLAITAGVVILVSAAIAACGSSRGSGSSAHANSRTTSATGGPSSGKRPIRIGVICDCSGIAASSFLGSAQVIAAWKGMVDAQGGINGNPVQVTELDDGTNPPTALIDAKKLVQQDHVVAIVDYSVVDAYFAKYVEQAGVPVIGGSNSSVTMNTNPDFFPTGGSRGSATFGALANAVKEGKPKVAVFYCSETPACTPALQKQLAKPAGASVVYTGAISATAPDYTSACLAAKSAGAQTVIINDSDTVVSRVITDCTAQGFKPLFDANAGSLGAISAANPAATGAAAVLYNPPITSTAGSGMQALHAALAKYAPGGSSKVLDATTQVWAGLQMVKLVAEHGHITGSSTPAQVKNALYTVKGQTLGGLSPAPITYVKGKPTANLGYFRASVQGGKVHSVAGGGATAVPASAVGVVKAKGS